MAIVVGVALVLKRRQRINGSEEAEIGIESI
jgi:hypothetical protein